MAVKPTVNISDIDYTHKCKGFLKKLNKWEVGGEGMLLKRVWNIRVEKQQRQH